MNQRIYPAGWQQAFTAWLLTSLFGLVILVAFLALFIMTDSNYRGGSGLEMVGPVAGGVALLSLPLVPLEYFSFRYVLAIQNTMLRLLAAAAAIAAFFGVALLLLPLVSTGIMDYATFMVLFVYFPASFVAHAMAYRAQLFRRNAPAETE